MNIISFIDEKTYELFAGLISDKMTTIMMMISHLGSAIALIILCATAFVIIKDRKYPVLISLNLIGVFLLNRLLKIIFRRNRPPVFGLIKETGYSFPSGHAMVSTAFYGLIIYLLYKKMENKKTRNLIVILLSMLIFAIGISRIYLGVHYTTDVLGGFIFGLIFLKFFIKYTNKPLQATQKKNYKKTADTK